MSRPCIPVNIDGVETTACSKSKSSRWDGDRELILISTTRPPEQTIQSWHETLFRNPTQPNFFASNPTHSNYYLTQSKPSSTFGNLKKMFDNRYPVHIKQKQNICFILCLKRDLLLNVEVISYMVTKILTLLITSLHKKDSLAET